MNKINDIEKNALLISLIETEKFLDKISKRNSYKILSPYPTINHIDCRLEKGNKCFDFSADELSRKDSIVKYKDKEYGYIDPFELMNDDFHLIANEGAGELQYYQAKGFIADGKLRKLQSNSFENNSFHRAIFTIPIFFNIPCGFIESLPFKIGNVLRPAGGYIRINIQGYQFGIFDFQINKADSLIIECYSKIDSETFEKYSLTINYCIGFISGSLIRDEVFYLQFTDNKFNSVTGFRYKKLDDSINGFPIIDPNLYIKLHKSTSLENYLSKNVFENIVNNCCADLRLFRAIKILAESQNYPLEIRASTISVALETIKNIIIEENEDKINPFKQRKTASKIIKIIKQIIDLLSDSEFNNKKAVMNKIEQLNQVGNRDSFLLSFELQKIKLNEDDINCINMRNDFLHGRLPYEEESELTIEDFRLHHIVFKLHLLTSSLIMKYCGYSGFMMNNIKMLDILHFEKNINEPLFRKI